ncbi:MAG: pilus assembly PilX N-terminal domain-containing protein [Deltaproteobacteria bacterium]|nr:pilus assembly PilX N-terminal domain-containing protein [Deltaproteobacteria bacterium]
MKEKSVLVNEDGSVLVIALVMLALLTIMGISASTTSDIELQIAHNNEVYTENVYLAEAAAIQGVQILEDVVPNPRDNPPGYLNPTVGDIEDDILTENYWKGGAPVTPQNGYDDPNTSGQDTQILAGSQGVVGGSSLDMGKSNVYGYTIYGRCERKNNVVIVGVGYRRAF